MNNQKHDNISSNLIILTTTILLLIVTGFHLINNSKAKTKEETSKNQIRCTSKNNSSPVSRHYQDQLPKNIILFIGDGMGIAHITAAKTVQAKLNLERFKTLGLITTDAADNYITDSAAAATALATGYKVNKGAISCHPDGTSLKTILEYAHETAKSTGIVVTSSVTHATPASFIAHVQHRKYENSIAETIAQSKINVLLGGGLAYFTPKSTSGSMRQDEKNLIAQLANSHHVITSASEFKNIPQVEKLVGLLAPKHLKKASDRKISLAEMTQKAIEILSKNPNGFLLIVEGSQIDFAAHYHNSDWIIEETIDFDQAVGIGLNYAENDDSTLLVVTADHETGGYALEAGSIKQQKISKADFTTFHHTGEMVPLFAYGTGSDIFGGIHDNTEIGKILIDFIIGYDKKYLTLVDL